MCFKKLYRQKRNLRVMLDSTWFNMQMPAKTAINRIARKMKVEQFNGQDVEVRRVGNRKNTVRNASCYGHEGLV